jgi:hypothetical protein
MSWGQKKIKGKEIVLQILDSHLRDDSMRFSQKQLIPHILSQK